MPEVSRKDAKALRFGEEIAALDVNPTNLRCFDGFFLFAPSRLGVKGSLRVCVAEASRRDAEALGFFASQGGRRSTGFAV